MILTTTFRVLFPAAMTAILVTTALTTGALAQGPSEVSLSKLGFNETGPDRAATTPIAAPAEIVAALTAELASKRDEFVIEAGAIKISDLIDRSATFLGWNILVNPQELQHCSNEFQLQNRITTDREGCQDLLTTMLATRDVVVRTLDDSKALYEVVALHGQRGAGAMSSGPQRSPEEILARPHLRLPVVTLMPLQHINAIHANNALRPFFASGGQRSQIIIGNMGSEDSLLIAGSQSQVANAIRLVQRADAAAGEERSKDRQAETSAVIDRLEKRIRQLEKELDALRSKRGKGK